MTAPHKTIIIAALTFLVTLLGGAAAAQYPWVESVIDYSPVNPPSGFSDPSRIIGPPGRGGAIEPDNSGVVSLGSQGGSITVRFDPPIENHPDNPMGLDFIVYSNAFFVGGNPQRRFQEPAILEVAEDTNGNGIPDGPWYLIPGSRGFSPTPFPWRSEPPGTTNDPPADPTLMAGSIRNPNSFDGNPTTDNIEYNWGYADMTPTAVEYLDNRMRPDDPFAVGITPGSGGGDAFDISWAVDANGQPANLERIHFIRITSFIDRTLGVFGPVSPEIDAIAAVAPDIDTDGNGILDDYEIFVAGTDHLRPESTVLPLEIPSALGGSPAGTLLGTAQDALGNRIRLFSTGPRLGLDRPRNVTVDILPDTAPPGALPDQDLLPSQTGWEFVSGEPNFNDAQIGPAEFRIVYAPDDIDGLEEESLAPWRLQGGVFTQAGITNVQLNTGAKSVSFRSTVPGVFILAAAEGEVEPEPEVGPAGPITLTANPPGGVTANPANTVTITSGVILDVDASVVPDGTLITVSTTRGTIITADADASTDGIQVATSGGVIAFDIQAPTAVGGALITAASVEGSASGDLSYTFTVGPPAPPVAFTAILWTGPPVRTVTLRSNPVTDAFGNPVPDGTLLTLDLAGASFTGPDADDAEPGYQAAVIGGAVTIIVEVPADESFSLATFADSAQTVLLAQQQFGPASFPSVPLRGAWLVALLLLIAGLGWEYRRGMRPSP